MAREALRPAPQAAVSPAFSQCVAGAWPCESRPRPSLAGPVTQARPAGSAPPSASYAHDSSGPAAIPPSRGASGLAGSPGSDAAARVTATPRLRRGLRCLPPPRPEPLLTRISGRPPTLGRRRVVLAGPAEVWPRPSAPGLPRLELRATRRPLLLLLPCPPAGPPPPAAAAAACTTQPPPSRRPSAAPRPPGFTGSGDRGAKPWGREGRNAPPSASGAGEPRNRRRHRPASGGGGGAPKPPSQSPWSPLRGKDHASRGHFYLRAMASASQTPGRVLPDVPNPPPGFPAALASGRPLKSRLPATSDFSWGPSRGWGLWS